MDGRSGVSSILILLSDAMILMDMGHVQGLDALKGIASVEVLDVVLQECDHESQPNLVDIVRSAGIAEIVTSRSLVTKATEYCLLHTQLSLQDALCLHYARENSRILLTNEKQLRNRCNAESIEVHGTIWILEQVHERKLRRKRELCEWISILSTKERRLPVSDLNRLSELFGCKSSD